MTETNRNGTSGAVEQIMRNMTSDIHNVDGQYRQLGYVTPTQHPETWNISCQNTYMNSYNMCNTENHMPFQNINSQPVNFNYSNHYPEQFDKNLNGNDIYPFNIYSNLQNGIGVQDINRYTQDYKYSMPNVYHHNMHSMPDISYIPNHQEMPTILNNPKTHQATNKSPLIDNLVGNWTSNTSGTYSPFGNVPATNMSNIFESDLNCLSSIQQEKRNLQDSLEKTSEDTLNFQFNREYKKPRIIAEVKPMRPTYSDVLLKTAPNPNTKLGKIETKDFKAKKDSKKSVKNEKQQKGALINRMNINNEIKDLNTEKTNQLTKSFEKNKENKSGQLNRKWVSLDNVSESYNDSKIDSLEAKNKKNEDINLNKSTIKNSQKKVTKNYSDNVDTDSGSSRNDFSNTSKNTIKKGSKTGLRQRSHDSFGGNDRSGKKSQRNRKRDTQLPLGVIGEKLKGYTENWWRFCIGFLFWLWNLVSDVFSLSLQIIRDGMYSLWSWSIVNWAIFKDTSIGILKRIHVLNWIYDKFKKGKGRGRRFFPRNGLQYNINMPMTGEEAMKRLLACKGKDPYSILGVTPTCTDDDIKRYYKKQAVLVHPDKNKQLGAEEAFKILVHAFDMIGEPERRAAYDRESAHVEQAWTELTELLAQFQQKVEAASKTIRCSFCGSGHKRIKVDRPCYAARNCNTCKIYHAAREGDIWAEAKCFGFMWRYYACMEGGVYDITKWAGCQKNSLKQLKPDSHNVQYRIALGKYTNSSCKKNNNNTQNNNGSPRSDEPASNFEDLLNKFYEQMDTTSQNARRKSNKKFK